MSELRVLKLVNGDEVIGYVDNTTQTPHIPDTSVNLIIRGPMRVIQEYNPKSHGHSLFLCDWMPSAKSYQLPISKDKIITTAVPKDDLAKHYLEIMTHRAISEINLTKEDLVNEDNLRLLRQTKFTDDEMN